MKNFLLALVLASAAFAADLQLEPPTDNGATLFKALSDRRSDRTFSGKALSAKDLGGLCWSAAGKNRDDGHLTVPSAMAKYEITLYVFNSEGAYKYNSASHSLTQVAKGDFRAATGVKEQIFVAKAAVNLVYVLDLDAAAGKEDLKKTQFGAVMAGAMAQNVGLYAAAHNLGNVVRGSYDEKELAKILKLGKRQVVVLAQSVGPLD